MKVEAYNTIKIRDWLSNTVRDEEAQQWRLDLKLFCETPDSGTARRGVFTVVITHPESGQVIYRLLQPGVLTGDENREATFLLDSIWIPYSQVIIRCKAFCLMKPFEIRVLVDRWSLGGRMDGAVK